MKNSSFARAVTIGFLALSTLQGCDFQKEKTNAEAIQVLKESPKGTPPPEDVDMLLENGDTLHLKRGLFRIVDDFLEVKDSSSGYNIFKRIPTNDGAVVYSGEPIIDSEEPIELVEGDGNEHIVKAGSTLFVILSDGKIKTYENVTEYRVTYGEKVIYSPGYDDYGKKTIDESIMVCSFYIDAVRYYIKGYPLTISSLDTEKYDDTNNTIELGEEFSLNHVILDKTTGRIKGKIAFYGENPSEGAKRKAKELEELLDESSILGFKLDLEEAGEGYYSVAQAFPLTQLPTPGVYWEANKYNKEYAVPFYEQGNAKNAIDRIQYTYHNEHYVEKNKGSFGFVRRLPNDEGVVLVYRLVGRDQKQGQSVSQSGEKIMDDIPGILDEEDFNLKFFKDSECTEAVRDNEYYKPGQKIYIKGGYSSEKATFNSLLSN